MAKTLDVALWGLFLVVLALALLLDILALGVGAFLQGGAWEDDGQGTFLPPPMTFRSKLAIQDFPQVWASSHPGFLSTACEL